MISFGGGLPAAELFPLGEFNRATESVLIRHGGKALQYGESEGVPELREFIAGNLGVKAENILITSGAQQALDLIGRVLIDPGDIVAVENPTYLALLSSWRVHQPDFRAVASDANGLAVSQLPRASKLVYLVPNFQNPQGTTLSTGRRLELAESARRHGSIVVEDDPYGELRYEGEPLPSVFEIAGKCDGPVLRVGTFSKVLSPGLRVGWVTGNATVIEKLVQAKQSADLHTSTLNQYLAFELASSGLLATHVPKLCAEYKLRRDAMLSALENYLPRDVTWSKPAGGMFLLLKLPEAVSGRSIAELALARNVLVVPGDDFHLEAGGNTLRLNFSNSPPGAIQIGVERLGEIVTGCL
jgi:2-aminoadipate transaminase